MEKLLRLVYASKKISSSLKTVSHASVILCVISYAGLLAHFCATNPLLAVRLLLAGGVPFVLVSLVRKMINAPRPYEIYDFYTVPPKAKRGRSFPSRHVFSAFLIAGFAYTVSLPLSIALLVLAILLATARVLLGMHFIRDVAAGALLGILSAILGVIILF